MLSPGGWSLVVAVALVINHTDPGQVTSHLHPQSECLVSRRTSLQEGKCLAGLWVQLCGLFSATIRDLVSLLVAMF